MSNLKYSIIIGTYNQPDRLKACCESIKKFTDLSQCEIIIVANGCKLEYGLKEYVENLGEPFKLLWFDNPLGYAGANNKGLAVATSSDYVILLNDDTVLLDQPKNQWLDYLVKPFLDDPYMGITGPFIAHNEVINDTFVIFFCACLSRKILNHIPRLGEDFEIGIGEDVEYCYLAKKLGYHIAQITDYNKGDTNKVVGGFPIYHEGGATITTIDIGEIFLQKTA